MPAPTKGAGESVKGSPVVSGAATGTPITQSAPDGRNEARFKRIIERLEKARQEAQNTQNWVSVDIVAAQNWRLRVAINPGGTPALILQAPSLRNRLVIASEEAIDAILTVLTTFKNDDELKRATFTFLEKYGYRPRRTATYVID